jgi:polyisoprenyl-phosphate glycosyltransferase
MKKFIILIPLYNDWKSVSKLLEKIDLQISNWEDSEVSIILVNDASTEERSGLEWNYKKIKLIKILNMKENRVHQRCIAAGLKYICKNENFDHVIVMDADGEDRPEELNEFYKKVLKNPNITITGNRFKRSEGFVFRFLYEVHKLLTLIFTGKLIKFGNFTCLPKNHVEQLIKKPYLWNSYSSSVVGTINNRTSIASTRGLRYVLPSKMNFAALIFHSLAIISVFRNKVIVRSIIFFSVYLFLVFNNISLLTLIPIFFLLIFVFIILKISNRSNIEGLNSSLENIGSIDTLGSSNSR